MFATQIRVFLEYGPSWNVPEVSGHAQPQHSHISTRFHKVPEDSGRFHSTATAQPRFQKVLEGSRRLWKVPQHSHISRRFRKVLEGSRGRLGF